MTAEDSAFCAPTLAIALSLALASSASSTVVPGGNLPGNTTWSLAGSPYDVTGDLTIPGGVTLTVDPGVTVHFAASDDQAGGVDVARIELIVQGSLIADGTSSPIEFRALGTPSTLAWYGIRLDPAAGGCTLRNAHLRDAYFALTHRAASGVLTMENVYFDGCNTDIDRNGGGDFALAGTLHASRVLGDLTVPGGVRFEHNGVPGGSVTGALTFLAGSTFAAHVRGQFDTDRLFVQGGLALDGALDLDVSAASVPLDVTAILLINATASPTAGTFSTHPEGTFIPTTGFDGVRITYAAGTGNDVGLTGATLVGVPAGKPGTLRIRGVRPNPGGAAQTLDLEIPEGTTWARVELLDAAGRRLRRIVVGGTGARAVLWDGRDDAGGMVSAGLYWVRLVTDRGHASARLVRAD